MFKYFISREFFLTLAGLVLAGVLVYLAVFFMILPLYTRHGSGITVPDVQGKSIREGQKILDDADLRPDLTDSVYVEGLPPGTIVKQYPGPYSRVKPDRLVSLTINQEKPPMVAVPDIEEMILYQAKVRLEGLKLSLGRVSYKPHIGKDKVLNVSYKGEPLKEGAKVPLGAKIDVVVGQGLGSQRVPVPDLVGMSYQEAYGLVQEIGINLVPIYNPNGPEEFDGKIYGQNPKSGFGDAIQIGGSISVMIKGSEPESNEGILLEKSDGN